MVRIPSIYCVFHLLNVASIVLNHDRVKCEEVKCIIICAKCIGLHNLQYCGDNACPPHQKVSPVSCQSTLPSPGSLLLTVL